MPLADPTVLIDLVCGHHMYVILSCVLETRPTSIQALSGLDAASDVASYEQYTQGVRILNKIYDRVTCGSLTS